MNIHLTKKDFKIDWFSGSGAGGQHRNKHQNCCRITHIETGISVVGTRFRERKKNQEEAFRELCKRIIPLLMPKQEYEISTEVVRNYNEHRNEVHDKASGLKQSYKYVVVDGNIEDMIEARKEAKEK